MKPRSKALYEYLLQEGVLHGSDEAIARAKQDYRKLYKQQWKTKVRPKKEIRLDVTLKQFAAIKAKAELMAMPHTTYARAVILASITTRPAIRHDTLLQVLQLLSMAVIETARDTRTKQVHDLLQQAETLLLQYLDIPVL